MSTPNRFIKFRERLYTLRVQHAVTQCGQRLMMFVFTHLFEGDMNDIKTCILRNLGSNSLYNRSFNKIELDKLENGDFQTWSVALLFKVIKISCGLQFPNQNQQTLEHLLSQLKKWQMEISTDFYLILTRQEMDKYLEILRELSFKILVALSDKVQINEGDGRKINQVIEYIINDVKQTVNET